MSRTRAALGVLCLLLAAAILVGVYLLWSPPVPSDEPEDYVILLHVNREGHVVLHPLDAADEDDRELRNVIQVLSFMKRRYEEDIRAAGGDRTKPPRSVVVIQVDEATAIGKVNGVMRACRTAGYPGARLGITPGPETRSAKLTEFGVPIAFPKDGRILPNRITLRVSATDTGGIRGMTITEDGVKAAPTDVGTDLNACREELRRKQQARAANDVYLELDERLRVEQAITLIETATGAGFTDVIPGVPEAEGVDVAR